MTIQSDKVCVFLNKLICKQLTLSYSKINYREKYHHFINNYLYLTYINIASYSLHKFFAYSRVLWVSFPRRKLVHHRLQDLAHPIVALHLLLMAPLLTGR